MIDCGELEPGQKVRVTDYEDDLAFEHKEFAGSIVTIEDPYKMNVKEFPVGSKFIPLELVEVLNECETTSFSNKIQRMT